MRIAHLSFLLLLFLTLLGTGSCAQQAEKESGEKEDPFRPHHLVSIALSHANVLDGIDEEGHRKTLSMPAWGIDYTYQFHPKWAIGLHTDLIVEKFTVQENLSSEGGIMERSFPVAPALMGIFKPNRHWSFLFGAGIEFEKDENLFLNRAGIEYGGELPKNWEVFGLLSYDFKWNAYDTWVIGIGIGKSFGFSNPDKNKNYHLHSLTYKQIP